MLQMKRWKESPKKWKPRGKTGRLKRIWRCERAYKKRNRTKRIARGQRLYISEMFVTARETNLSETVRKSVFGKLLMITTSLRQTEKAGIRVCFMSKDAPTGAI